jgi:hypothetical protein
MRIDSTHPEYDSVLCFFDGKWCKYAVAADDEEGWVDVVDPQAMDSKDAIQDLNKADPTTGETIEEWSEIKLKRLFGKVEFKKATCRK